MKHITWLYHCCTIYAVIMFFSCMDTTPPNSTPGFSRFVSGPKNSIHYNIAKGMVHSAEESLGVFMDNTDTESSIENAIQLANKDAYLGFVQEDIFRYAKNKYIAEYDSNPGTAYKRYIRIASQLEAIMVTHTQFIYLLVNTDRVTDIYNDTTKTAGTDGKITLNDLLTSTRQLTINLGSIESDTYITAKTIIDAHTFLNAPSINNESDETGISNVISGSIDAAFLLAPHPSPVLKEIGAEAPVELVRVYMPDDKKYYSEKGMISNSEYLFQNNSINSTITVRTLLAAGPHFIDDSVGQFIDYITTNAKDYEAFDPAWSLINKNMSQQYMLENSIMTNHKALCHMLGFDPVKTDNLEPYLASGPLPSSYHNMTTELIWLLSYNLDIDLREKDTTGAWENSYWLADGGVTLALTQDDIYSYLGATIDANNSMMISSMKKIIPLHNEYVHVLVNNEPANWTSWNFGTASNIPSELTANHLRGIFTHQDGQTPVLHINLGPKTSGTFMAAMKIIESYKNYDSADSDTTADFEQFEIHYYFDEPADAVKKVALGPDQGGYHITFVSSGVPYHRFYSHDTYSIAEITNARIIPARFYDSDNDGSHIDNTPEPYREGILAGGGTAVYENYPYPLEILPANITTARLRALLVASPAFNPPSIETYIRAIIRKAYYKVHPWDPDDLDFSPDPLWMPIIEESYTPNHMYFDTTYGTYGERIEGIKEYFVRNPYGWNKKAAEYYLSMFPDN